MWVVLLRAYFGISIFWTAVIAAPDVELEFIAEPISRLVKISETKAVFRCIASPPSAKIRWLYRGQPIAQNIRWIRESDHKLTVLLSRMDRMIKSPHVLNNIYFQCEVRLKGHVLVSAPAKLTLAVLDEFPPQPDALLSTFVGNTAVIPCDPPHSEPIVVTEFSFNQTFITSSTERQKLMPSGDLQILNATHNDAGEYRCIANNPYLFKKVIAQRKVILRIENPTENTAPYFAKTQQDLAVALGSNVTLECAAVGYPVPKITWHKHHGNLPFSRHHQIYGNLHIINIKKGDEGIYVCEAENSAGPRIAERTLLEVHESPQIASMPKSLSVEIGDNFTLNCTTKGHPKPNLTWIHNGRTITGHHTKRSPLVIYNANKKHSGIYQCFASNRLGTVYASIVVTVKPGNNSLPSDYDDSSADEDYEESVSHPKAHKNRGNEYENSDPGKEESDQNQPPKKPHKKKHKGVKLVPPSKPYVTRLSNTSVMVRWNVPRNDGLPIIFFKVQYKEVGRAHSDWETVEEDIAAHIHSYAVTDLKPGAAYRFQIAAVYSNNDNKSGPMSAKFVLLKDSPMEKPSPAPVIISAEAASPSAITLNWKHEQKNNVPVVGYFIHYRATHTAGKYLKVTVLGTNTRSHIISHLLPDTGYDIKMQSFNEAGTSEFSNIFMSKTKPAEVVPGTRARNKPHQSEGADISHTETVSSRDAENRLRVYIIAGSIFGVLIIIVFCCMVVFFRQKNNLEAASGCWKKFKCVKAHLCCTVMCKNCRNQSCCYSEATDIPDDDDKEEGANENDHDDPLRHRNGYAVSNGYLAVNKMGINVNPLSHLDIEDNEKPDELEDIVSNNNEIIRLQTFSMNADHTVDPLLNGIPVNESQFNGDEESDSVIISGDSRTSAE